MNILASTTKVAFELNGRDVEVHPFANERLSMTLRDRLDAREVKIGCNAGDCGACTVLMDGEAVCACLIPTHQTGGSKIETVAGLTQSDAIGKRIANGFQDHGAAQCGFCTPGMIVAAVDLIRKVPDPSEEQVKDALGGVLCRCTGYRKIIEAVLNATVDQPGEGFVGDAIRRLDGGEKVSGQERFGDDIATAGTLELKVVRSPYPSADFELGDLEQWCRDIPGIEAVLTANDVPGENRFGAIPNFEDQPVFAEKFVRFQGEAVAAVIGTPLAIRSFNQDEFPITWTKRPPIMRIEEATADGADLLHETNSGNVLCQGFVMCGDAEGAISNSHVVVEGEFSTGFVEHAYLEPEAGFAEMEDDRVVIHACTQAPVMDQEAVQRILGWDKDRIRVIPTGIGGGFGSKIDVSIQPYLALAAVKTGRPVRIAYSRTESMRSTTKRHPAKIKIKIGADRTGRISGMEFHGEFNTGAYASWGPTVATRVPIHASGPYSITNYRAKAVGIYTNCPPAGAFRGFGVPQSAIAQESMLDELAGKLGIDPLEFRINNALEDGKPTVCGQVFAAGVGIRECLIALQPAWRDACGDADEFNKTATNGMRRGVGVASAWYGCGNTSLPNPSTIRAGVGQDGSVVLHQGAVDIGQGSNTVIAQIFATELGIPVSEVKLIGGDTDLSPDAGKTSASRQTFVSGNAAKMCASSLRSQILRRFNASMGSKLTFGEGRIRVSDNGLDQDLDLASMEADGWNYVFSAEETYDPPTKALDKNGQGTPYAQFGYAAQLAVVEVDLELGTVVPLRFVAAHDVGKAINPLLVEGQVQGGIAQGLGMALMEEFIPGKTDNLHDYLIPTIGDVPPIDTIIVEVPDLHGPFGAKGLGEHALIPTAPAILNAIKRATGIRMYSVPVTPSKLGKAIKEKRNAD